MTKLTKDIITDNEKARQLVAREMLKFRGVEHHTLGIYEEGDDCYKVLMDLSIYELGISRKIEVHISGNLPMDYTNLFTYNRLKHQIQELAMCYFTQENNKNAE